VFSWIPAIRHDQEVTTKNERLPKHRIVIPAQAGIQRIKQFREADKINCMLNNCTGFPPARE